MSNLSTQIESKEYLKALKTTEEIESPALGFAKTLDYKSTIDLQRVLIKQNNTLISLFFDITKQVQDLTDQVQGLRRSLTTEKQKVSKDLEQSVDELTKKIGSLNLGQDLPIPKKKGSILVYRNPSDILAQEKKK